MDLAAAGPAAESTVEGRMFDDTDSKLENKWKRFDHVQGFLIDLGYVLHIEMKFNNGEGAVTHIISIFQSGAFDAEVFGSYEKYSPNCDDLCQQRENVSIVNGEF